MHDKLLMTGLRVTSDDFLLTSAVTRPTLERYGKAVDEFRAYAQRHRWSLARVGSVDRAMKKYFNVLFADGFGAWEGRNLFYGYRMLVLKTRQSEVLPL